jgi:glycosidase
MKKLFALSALILLLNACSENPKQSEQTASTTPTDTLLKHVEWSKNATIYEANIRQMTPQGTFKALEGQLEKIKELGIKIIWIMPIQPIGELNRKGELGSYYSIKDYTTTNPEFGSLADFKSLVKKAHELDMKVILDWVANHSSWDNTWTIEHPEWYTKDSLGGFIPPNPDWSDVIDLNYDNKELWTGMIDAMKFWVIEADIDGFRCDVAYDVPTAFWNESRKALFDIKPVFMLAEADMSEHHKEAFDMSYGWELMHLTKHIYNGDSSLSAIDAFMSRESERFNSNDYRMYLLTSHDENSWNGTIEERYGPSEKAVAVLTYTIGGMPLIYAGQEYGNTKSLAFFEKDNPVYENPEIYDFYKTLMDLNVTNQALWNGNDGGRYERINTNDDERVYALVREKNNNTVISVVNLSDQELTVLLYLDREYDLTDAFSGEEISLTKNKEMILEPYGYRVFFR